MYEIFHLVKLMAYYKYKQMNREMRVYIIINPFVERNFMERGTENFIGRYNFEY